MSTETTTDLRHKLIFTVVKKGAALKVISAAKKAGAEGATTLLGHGTAPPGTFSLWGLGQSLEKEIVLIMARGSVVESVFTAIRRIMKLHKPDTGISLVVDILQLAGCVHIGRKIQKNPRKSVTNHSMENEVLYDLIVTIVNSGHSDEVMQASREAGAEGGTIIHGRGSGIHETSSLFSMAIEPEKDIILTLVERDISEKVLKSIVERAQLNEPGKGIAFMLEVEQAAGIAHRTK
ncbi:MAG: P-II family nitrogen regulator [Bacteroidetes bacterium]|nr:P-II family nitrogen regulator [Bacteroidota bacterium]